MRHEPIFTRQEQGVVYLFSRYWQDMDEFRGKRISRIHTHFPDFYVEDLITGAEEAIEFEYALSDFRSHLGDLRHLYDHEIRLLYIVYWDRDDNEKELRRSIRGRGRKNDFNGKVKFICLKDYFGAGVEPGPDRLSTSWLFSKKHLPKAYSFSSIDEDTTRLETQGILKRLWPDKRQPLYRASGFNKIGAEYIECAHWKRIHFYTTSRIAADKIPSKLLLRPTGCPYFSGYFAIRYGFFIDKGSRQLPDYFKNYYFYPYYDHYKESTCLVYSDFKELTHDQGGKLYRFLKDRVRLDVRGSKLIDPDDNDRIDRIMNA
jgi:hypothetical protein